MPPQRHRSCRSSARWLLLGHGSSKAMPRSTISFCRRGSCPRSVPANAYTSAFHAGLLRLSSTRGAAAAAPSALRNGFSSCLSVFTSTGRPPAVLPRWTGAVPYLGLTRRSRVSSRRLGVGISPSRCACLRAAFRARRIASAFSRVLRSDGFS
jgi:hypothetical protein